MYRGADKSLARPGRKQATATEDFDFHICVVLCFVMLFYFVVLFYVLFVCKCVLPPGDNPIAVNKYIISYPIYKHNWRNISTIYIYIYTYICIYIKHDWHQTKYSNHQTKYIGK